MIDYSSMPHTLRKRKKTEEIIIKAVTKQTNQVIPLQQPIHAGMQNGHCVIDRNRNFSNQIIAKRNQAPLQKLTSKQA
jgi:hypothetical protein